MSCFCVTLRSCLCLWFVLALTGRCLISAAVHIFKLVRQLLPGMLQSADLAFHTLQAACCVALPGCKAASSACK